MTESEKDIDRAIARFERNLILVKYVGVLELLVAAMPYISMYAPYFDMDSLEMLDEKERVLKAVLDGQYYRDIPGFFDIFEKMGKVEL